MGVNSVLTVLQTNLSPEKQKEFRAALETGKPVWYRGKCWSVIAYHPEPDGLRCFDLMQVQDQQCN